MRCRRCGAVLQQGMVICPECGARQRQQASSVRCANCGDRVSVELTVCPHCGRDVRPAGPRWVLWLSGLVVVTLFGLWGLGKLPVEQGWREFQDTRARLARIAQISELAVSASVPSGTQTNEPAKTSLPADQTPVLASMTTATLGPDSFTGEVSEVQLDTDAGSMETLTLAAGGTVTATVASAPGTVPSQGSPAAPEPSATLDKSQYYEVRSGDTLEGIGTRLGIPWTLIAETNSLGANTVLQIGQRLRLPAPTPVPTATPTALPSLTASATPRPSSTPTSLPTATPSATRRINSAMPTVTSSVTSRASATSSAQPTALVVASQVAATASIVVTSTPAGAPVRYQVRSGDTLAGIGAAFGVPWETIAAVNKITAATSLQVGQELIIPAPGSPLPPTATARPRPTATPTPPAPTPQPFLPAPVLDSPGNGTPFKGDGALIELKWLPVIGMPPEARYQVTVQWIDEQGAPQEYNLPLTAGTAVRMPLWLFGRARQATRQYTWFVTPVQATTDGQGQELVVPLGPSSTRWVLYWN
jgi:LysM repeat protein/RNA polymerase subunit RPABC4/transcription elongation factor Spt4